MESAILIHFIDFDLESGYDFLSLYNGATFSDDTLIMRITGSRTPRDLAEVTSTLWLRFQSDSIVTEPGFRLMLTVIGEGILI